MKPSQIALSVIVVLLYVVTLGALAVATSHYVRGALWACLLFETVITLRIFASTLRSLTTNTMILLSFLGDPIRLYSPRNSHGILGTGLVVPFPPGLVKANVLPIDAFDVPFASSGASTKKDTFVDPLSGKDITEPMTPVTVFIQVTMQLPDNLPDMTIIAQELGILNDEHGDDLSHRENLKFYSGHKDGVPDLQDLKVPCIAHTLQSLLQGTVNEGVGRAIPNYGLSAARKNSADIEIAIMEELSKPNKISEKAGLLSRQNPGNWREIKVEDSQQRVHIFYSRCPLFDINIITILPSNVETLKALSVETQKMLEAQGAIREAEGIATSTKLVAEQLKTPEGRAAFNKDLAKALPQGTVLSVGVGSLDAAITKFMGNK